MKGERSGMATPRNPMPRAAIAEIDEAMMALATAQRDVMKLSQTNDPGVLSIIVRLLHTLHEAEKSLIAAKGGAISTLSIDTKPDLADNPVRIRFSGSGYQAADRQALVLLAAAWWEHADIHSTLKCRCLPVRSNVNDRMREGAGSFGNFSKPNIAQRDSV